MIFSINLLYSILICYLLGITYSKYKLSSGVLFIQILIIIGVIWIAICGGQYYVGSDYPTYLNLFNGNNIEYYQQSKSEYLFYYIVVFLNAFGIRGQALFYIFYLINFTFLFFILKRLNRKCLFIFILLYITYSNIFNNQLNMIRQATAIHICTYAAFLYAEEKKKLCTLFIIIASLIHTAALFMFSIFLFQKIKNIKVSYLKIILLASTIGLFFISSGVFSLISNILPIQYQLHLQKEVEDSGVMSLMTKFIFIPLFWMSCNLDIKNFSKRNKILFYMGFVGFCLKLLLLKLPVVHRLADYYILLSIFPIYFLLEHLYFKRKKVLFFCICVFLLLFYGIKTIAIPKGEYLYDSIYF